MAGTKRSVRTLSPGTLTGLFFLYKYRFLTIAQFARAANFSLYHAAEVLRDLAAWGAVGFFGFVGIIGQGKTPKVYYLTQKGFSILQAESEFSLLEPFVKVHKEATWTPQMYHRLAIIDLLISAEMATRHRSHLQLLKAFLEYRMIKRGSQTVRETTDFVALPEISEHKIVPDAAFILENTETKKRALFFLEMDLATEQIVARSKHATIQQKMLQYDRYLQSFRFQKTYAQWGEFGSFILLFVTLTDTRIENIRRQLTHLPAELAIFYRFTTYEQAMGDFLGSIWVSRLVTDNRRYSLVREGN